MSHDVFISYSSHDKPIADGICANLEGAGLRCWIAPRDIGPGEDWPTAIAEGIGLAKVMVLVFSQNSNLSDEVSRELYLAANNRLAIVPFAIESVKPEAGKAYYMGRRHWMDAMNPPTEEQIAKLAKRVKSLVGRVGPEGRVASVLAPVVPPYFRKSLNRKYGWMIPVVELVVAAALVVGSVFTVGRVAAALNQPAATPTPAAAPTATPLPSIDWSLTLYREDFNDPQFDGSLPPGMVLGGGICGAVKVAQGNGSLTFDAPVSTELHCGVGLGSEFKMSQTKLVEFAVSSLPSASHPQFAVSLQTNGPKDSLVVACGLAAVRGGSGCFVQNGTGDIYETRVFDEKPGTTYTFRIEVVDPAKMSFRFGLNGSAFGEFTLPEGDAPAYWDRPFTISAGLDLPTGNATGAGTYKIDYLVVGGL